MKRFFIITSSRKTGPFEVSELQSMHIEKDYTVWDPATAHWSNAGEVIELQELFSNQIISLPEEMSIPEQVEISHHLEEVNSSQELVEEMRNEPQPIIAKKEKRKLSVLGWVMISVFVILVLSAVYFFYLYQSN